MIDVVNERAKVKVMRDIKSELETELSNIKDIHRQLNEASEGELIIQLIDTLSECETMLSNGLINLENDLNSIDSLIRVIHQRELNELMLQKSKVDELDVKVISDDSD